MFGSDSVTRRTAVKVLGALGLGSGMLASAGVAQPSDFVPERSAREVAKAKVEQLAGDDDFEDWERGGVARPELFYRPTSNEGGYAPTVYVFPVERSGTDVGYVTVAARKSLDPVLEFGTGPAPQHRLESATSSPDVDHLSATGRFLYGGANTYGVEAVPTESDHTGPRMIDLGGGFSGSLPVAPSVEEAFELDSDAARAEWTEIERTSADAWTDDVSTQSSDEISGVPNWTENDDGDADVEYPDNVGNSDDPWSRWDGCAPIAGSMAVGYHEGTWSSQRNALIDRLHYKMGTDDDGYTYPGGIPTGIEAYDRGYYDYSAFNVVPGDFRSRRAHTKDQIGKGNPPVLMTVDDAKDKSGHAETVIGYYDGSSFYYKCHDTYGNENWILHKSWDWGGVTVIEPE